MLKSTFPAFKDNEARRELIPSDRDGGGGGGSGVSLKTHPLYRASNGLLAGWLDPPPAFSQHSYVNTATIPATITASTAAAVADAGPNGTISSAPYSTTADGNYRQACASREVAGSGTASAGSSSGGNTSTPTGGSNGAIAFYPGKDTPCGGSRVTSCGNKPSLGVPSFAASKDIRRGDVVAVERPILALQSSQALPWVVACPGCLRHVGTLELQLAIASGEVGRAEAFGSGGGGGTTPLPPPAWPTSPTTAPQLKEEGRGEERRVEGREDEGEGGGEGEGDGEGGGQGEGEGEGEDRSAGLGETDCGVNSVQGRREEGTGGGLLPPLRGLSERFVETPIPCSAGCGAVYCGDACRRECWNAGHCVLCLGLVEDEEHPLVQHKVHAISHPQLEAPLLLAANLLVQEALAMTLERRRRVKPRRGGRSAAAQDARGADSQTTTSTWKSTSTLNSPRSRGGGESAVAAPAAAAAACAAAVVVASAASASAAAAASASAATAAAVVAAAAVATSAVAADPATAAATAAATGAAGGDQYLVDGGVRGMDEASAMGQLMKAFPRGRLREGSSLAPDAAVIRESWTLLAGALEAKSRGALPAAATDGASCIVDSEDFPLLLSERVHADVVRGLAANLMEVEVESPLVEYCEGLVTQPGDVQLRALQILEPALDAMDSNAKEEPQAPFPASLKLEPDAFRRGEADAARRSADSSDDNPAREANRSAARLAWRCVQAARGAARLVPALAVQALLPAAASRLPHSCAPNVRVPAGDRRGYNANRGGGGGDEGEEDAPAPGVAGWPLSVATVALRDVAAGSLLTCSWVDAEEDFTTRADLLKAYTFPSWDMSASDFPPPAAGGGCGVVTGGNGRRDGGKVPREEPVPVQLEGDTKGFTTMEERRIWEGRGWESGCGCWCLKCQTERQYLPGFVRPVDPCQMDILARLAVDEYRFDDASNILERQARLCPRSGDVLYRAGLCAINQGRWSRALRLWRDGLALTPDHAKLKDEDEKYNALAFWLDSHDSEISRSAGGATKAADPSAKAGKGGGKTNDVPIPFSSPPPLSPPPLQQETAKRADHDQSILGGEAGGTNRQSSLTTSSEGQGGDDGRGVIGNQGADDHRSVRPFAENLDLEFMGGGEWVCTTRAPPLSAEECAAVIAEAEEAASAKREAAAAAAAAAGDGGGGGSGWGTARHYAVPTTDMAVRDLPRTLAWFNAAMRTRIGPLVAAAAALGSGELDGPREEDFLGENERVYDSDGLGKVEEGGVGAAMGLAHVDLKGKGHAGNRSMRGWGEDADRGAACGDGSVNTDGVDCSGTLFGSPSEANPSSEPRSDLSRTVKGEAQDRAPASATATGAGAGAGAGAAGAATATNVAAAAAAAAAAADADADAFLRRLRVHDAFVVRYDAAAQRSLPLHTDQGEISLTIALNNSDEYEGGGTWFEELGRAVRPSDAGHIVVFPGGDTMHGGQEITRGIRYILAVFLYEHWTEEEEEEEEGEGEGEEEFMEGEGVEGEEEDEEGCVGDEEEEDGEEGD